MLIPLFFRQAAVFIIGSVVFFSVFGDVYSRGVRSAGIPICQTFVLLGLLTKSVLNKHFH